MPQPASARSLPEIGEDHVAFGWRLGWYSVRYVASGVCTLHPQFDVVAPPPFVLALLYCSDQWKLNLLRGVACQVRRIVPWRSFVSLNACRLLSKSTVQALGLPAFLLNHIPGTSRFDPVCRYVV